MIFDSIKNLERYSCIPRLDKIMSYLRSVNLVEMQVGEYEIDGKSLFVRVARYTSSPADKLKFETHRKYIDVQVMISGQEVMQVAHGGDLRPIGNYNEEGDFQFYSSERVSVNMQVPKDHFAVFFPEDPHRPGCESENGPEEVFKFVFKTEVTNNFK